MLLERRNPHPSLYPLTSLVPGSVRSGCKVGADGLDKSFLVAEGRRDFSFLLLCFLYSEDYSQESRRPLSWPHVAKRY